MTLQTFSKTAQLIPANQVVEGTSALVASAPPATPMSEVSGSLVFVIFLVVLIGLIVFALFKALRAIGRLLIPS